MQMKERSAEIPDPLWQHPKGFLSFVIFAYDVLLHYFNLFPLETNTSL